MKSMTPSRTLRRRSNASEDDATVRAQHAKLHGALGGVRHLPVEEAAVLFGRGLDQALDGDWAPMLRAGFQDGWTGRPRSRRNSCEPRYAASGQ